MKHKLDLVQWGVIPIVTYRSCLVTKLYGVGFKVLGVTVSSATEVDEIINNATDSIQNSIFLGNETELQK